MQVNNLHSATMEARLARANEELADCCSTRAELAERLSRMERQSRAQVEEAEAQRDAAQVGSKVMQRLDRL